MPAAIGTGKRWKKELSQDLPHGWPAAYLCELAGSWIWSRAGTAALHSYTGCCVSSDGVRYSKHLSPSPFQHLFIILPVNPLSFSCQPAVSPMPSSRQPLIALSLWICLFQIFYVKKIIQFMILSDWQASFWVIYIYVACISTLFLSNLVLYGCIAFSVSRHGLMGVWVASTLVVKSIRLTITCF